MHHFSSNQEYNRIKEKFFRTNDVFLYNQKKYKTQVSNFAKEGALKLYAKELGGNDFISVNCYKTESSYFLSPCEMPIEKVRSFINNSQPIEQIF